MQFTRRKTGARKRTGSRKSVHNKRSANRVTSNVAKPRRRVKRRKPTGAKKTHKRLEEETFVYQCTRPGCGYRIWRDDRAETGKVRFDLKCPKCHNEAFRCLGKSDIPETFNEPTSENPIDFEKLDKVNVGTN